ncbi:MAG: glycerol-3-phosphate 1-O-acyltransferase PlsY [Phycisphaerae bacterium]|nr:glycerol-3-phosphate 1-O-acyltransferase PlsY [Phycisphaerae bacterium]
MHWSGWAACALVAYLLGSIPFGVLLGQWRGVDVREHGSRNIGATNVGRVLGRRWGYLCFLLDAAKGAVPVAAAGELGGTLGRSADELGSSALLAWLAVPAAALAGHMASPFLGFKGGKGVATGFGALVGFWPLLAFPALAAIGVWIVVLAVGRIVSLASIVAALSLPIGVLVAGGVSSESWPLVAAASVLALLVVIRHRSNLSRLLRGQEPRIGAATRRAATPPDAFGHNDDDGRT